MDIVHLVCRSVLYLLYLAYPLRQGRAAARPQPPLLTHASALATSMSVLTLHKPQLLYIPHSTCTQHSTDNKGWPDSMQHNTNILFICTETWWQQWTSSSSNRSSRSVTEREELSHTGNKECSELISVCKDRSSYGRVSHAWPRFFYGSNPRRKRSQESSRGLWTLRNQTPKDLTEYIFKIIRCWS